MKSITLDWNLRMELLKAGLRDNLHSEGQLIKNKKGKEVLKVSRSSIISSGLIDRDVDIHNGLRYTRIKITKEMVGYRYGEFVNTTSWGSISKNDKRNVKSKSKK